MSDLKTVKVVHGDSYMVIYESDYDPKTQALYKPEKPKAKRKPKAKPKAK